MSNANLHQMAHARDQSNFFYIWVQLGLHAGLKNFKLIATKFVKDEMPIDVNDGQNSEKTHSFYKKLTHVLDKMST